MAKIIIRNPELVLVCENPECVFFKNNDEQNERMVKVKSLVGKYCDLQCRYCYEDMILIFRGETRDEP